MQKYGLMAAATVLAVATAGSAFAGKPRELSAVQLFVTCDGYWKPTRNDDGMGNYPLDRRALVSVEGGYSPALAVKACDGALASPLLQPGQWRRRVSLLLNRAVHRLEGGDRQGALGDLDEAEQAVVDPSDSLFARSQGVSLRALRAFILASAGDRQRAQSLAAGLSAQRPFNRAPPFLALAALGSDCSAQDFEKTVEGVARLQPSTIRVMLVQAADEQRWTDVLALYGQLYEPAWTSSGDDADQLQLVGIHAYALTVVGDAAAATQALAKARAEYEATLAPPDPKKLRNLPERVQSKIIVDSIRRRERLVATIGEQLAEWEDLIAKRQMIAAGRASDVLAGLSKMKTPPRGIDLEFRKALAEALVRDGKAPPESVKWLLSDEPAVCSTGQAPDLSALIRILPETETVARLPRYMPAKDGFFVPGGGFQDTPIDPAVQAIYGPDVHSLGFRSRTGSAATVEDMALLYAAQRALDAHKDGLIILDRLDVREGVMEVDYAGRGLGPATTTGYTTTLTVLFVESGDPPARFRGVPWRVISAQAVYDALSPVYGSARPAS